MSETLGSLCDKLTVVKLKQFHSVNKLILGSLEVQEQQLKEEIDEFIYCAVNGEIPLGKLAYASNKVYKTEGNEVKEIFGNIGEIISHLAEVNCKLWHVQELVYNFEAVPDNEKNIVVKKLALLNLERNKCVDRIDQIFKGIID